VIQLLEAGLSALKPCPAVSSPVFVRWGAEEVGEITYSLDQGSELSIPLDSKHTCLVEAQCSVSTKILKLPGRVSPTDYLTLHSLLFNFLGLIHV
jgi:hypothetical protein